ncbi:uncharacterized protein EI90DRAFT_747254 [Cantharellus anzutake]|uniref:uncharacterized protein n=1 Tax=Cantharellus anzutake TaxID=1750568 RepID=UPI00190462D2|nr:uncharacterized protein EI90DRAFT_747254 [Cantharellus anzutake]KAF8312160.1 hypothetical protein EI90DRAFT_747254 [Cantharellus anzutake]
MSNRFKFSKRTAPPGDPSNPVPNPQITSSPTESDATTSTDHGGSDRFRLEPLTTTDGSSRGRKQRRSVRYTIAKLLSRSPSPDPRQPDPSTPNQPLLNPLSSPVLPGGTIGISHMMPSECITHGNTETPHPPPGRTGVNLDAPSSMDRTPSSSAVTAGEGKKTIIAATRLVLQTAATALKLAPIPNLDQIPNTLLSWLQVYETIDNNDEDLKGLDDEVRNAHETIFRPLQLWTGQVPPAIGDLIQRFDLALKRQLTQIEALKRQKLSKRVILATEITQEISAVKSCIHDAISCFSVCFVYVQVV